MEYNSGRDEAAFTKFLLENVEGLKEWADANTATEAASTETE